MDQKLLSQLRNQKSKAIRKLATRDASGASEVTFFRVLIKLIDNMAPELDLTSYISHEELAKQAGVSLRQVRACLMAARAIGAIRVRYKKPSQAHADLIRRYPDYPTKVGRTFLEFRVERDTLNFYTIRRCSKWEGYSARKDALLPDWQLGIIKAHASQKATKIDLAYQAAGKRVRKKQLMKPGKRTWRLPTNMPVEVRLESPPVSMAAAAQNSHAHAIVGSRGVSMAAAAQNSLPKKGECEETPLDVVSSSTSPGFPEKKIISPTINPEPQVHPGIQEPDPLSTPQEDPPMANPDPVLKNLMTYINQHDFIPYTTVDKIVAAVSKYKDNPLATSIKDTILSNQVMAKACGYDGR